MGVTFDEEQQVVRVPQAGASGLYALVIRWGFAKDVKQAGIVLGACAGALIILALVILLFRPTAQNAISPREYQNPARVIIQPL